MKNIPPCSELPAFPGTAMTLIAMDTSKLMNTYFAYHSFNSYGAIEYGREFNVDAPVA